MKPRESDSEKSGTEDSTEKFEQPEGRGVIIDNGGGDCNADVGDIGSYKEMAAKNKGTGMLCNAHHIIQDAAAKGTSTGANGFAYSSSKAPAIIMTVANHTIATAWQNGSDECSGTYGGEYELAEGALMASGMSAYKATALEAVRTYFEVELGWTASTRTKVPNSRRNCKG